jgi:hypothetical protein
VGQLFVTCLQRGAPTDYANIRVTARGSVLFDGQASLSSQGIDLGSNAVSVSVEVKPFSTSVWPLSGRFSYDGQDSLTRDAGTIEEFTVANVPSTPLAVFCHLSALSDVSQQAADTIGLASWSLPALDIDVIKDPPIVGDQLDFDVARPVDPASSDAVLKVAGTAVPQVIAVSWPDAIPRDAPNVPFLLYFRPTLSQNSDDYQGFAYPFSDPYIRYTLFRYMAYQGDPPGAASNRPLGAGLFSKGIPDQLTAAGVKAVTVLACPRLGFPSGESGRWMDAMFVEFILSEVAGYFARRGNYYLPQFVGRVAACCFSSGDTFLSDFLEWNRSTNLYQNLLRELWIFDAVDAKDAEGRPQAPRVMQQATIWQQQGDDRLIRAYTQNKWIPEYQQLVGPPPTAPGSAESADLNIKVMRLDIGTWQRTTRTAGSQNELRFSSFFDWYDASHQLISATLLTDAARNSKF